MFFDRISDLVFTTPARLTLGFLTLFVVGSILIFTYLNYQLSGTLVRQLDKSLLDQERLLVLQHHEYGFSGVYRAIQSELASKGKEDRAYRIVDAKGKLIFEGGELRLPVLPVQNQIVDVELPATEAVAASNARVRSFSLDHSMSVFIAVSTAQISKLKDEFWRAFIKTEILVILLGTTLGLWLTHRFHVRVEAFNDMAKRIVKSGDLSSRVPIMGNDEFSMLATSVNAMLERIERLVQGIRQVSDNIAHDLRSPLTRLRADVEVALQQKDPEADRATLERVLSELDGMQTIFNSLLSLGQAEAGGMKLKRKEIDLSTFLAEMVELYTPSCEERNMILESSIEDGLQLLADRQLLAQTLSNLFENALKYVPQGGRVRLSARRMDDSIQILVEDDGPGISPEMQEKVFERFARVDPSRTLPGTGLGLALVKAFIELHNGTVRVEQSSLGGAAFVIDLPSRQPV
jgi:signal transduction histidine kinase